MNHITLRSRVETDMDSLANMDPLLLALLGILIVVCFWSSKSKKNAALNLPPSPKALPIIGHIHLLDKLLHRCLAKLARQHGPLMYLRLGSAPVIVVSSPEMAREVLQTHGTVFAGRPNFRSSEEILYQGKSLGSSQYGPEWKDLRKLSTTELFTNKRVNSFMVTVNEELTELLVNALESSKNDQLIEMRTAIRGFSFNVITRIMMRKTYFGAKSRDDSGAEEAGQFIQCVDELMEKLVSVLVSDAFPKLAWLDELWSLPRMRKIHRKADAFLQKVLEEHRQKKGSSADFVDILDSHFGVENEDFTKGTLLDLMLGGIDTSSTVLEWALGELMNHPDVMLKVQGELESVVGLDRLVEVSDMSKLHYLNAVIKETFRLHPPVPVTFRANPSAYTVKGYDIPKRSIVFINMYAVGRDPESWKNGEEFYPERFLETSVNVLGTDFELLPFGAGRRMCVGLPLGLKNVQVTLANLVHGFNWRFPKGKTKHSMVEHFGLTTYMREPLELKATPRLAEHVYGRI